MRKLVLFVVFAMFAAPSLAAAISLGLGQNRHGAAEAEGYAGHGIAQRNGCKSLAEAIKQVRRQYEVQRIISARTQRSGNREVHRIKFMNREGTVRTVSIQGCRVD